MPHALRTIAEEIGVDREDDVSLLDRVLRIDVVAKRQAASLACLMAAHRLPLDPLCLRQACDQLVNLRRERWRGDGFGEQTDAAPLLGLLRVQHGAHGADERAEGPDLTEIGERLRAIGIVEIEDSGLREHVRGAPARRVIGVAFNLGGPAFVRLDEQTQARSAERHGRRVEERLARDDLLRLPNVGNNPLVRLPGAGGDPGQGKRGAHQLEEAPASDRIQPLRRMRGKFAVQERFEFRCLRQCFEAAPVLTPARALEAGAERRDIRREIDHASL